MTQVELGEKSVADDVGPSSSFLSTEGFLSSLPEQKQKEEPNFIRDIDGDGPYSHFLYPIGGLRPPRAEAPGGPENDERGSSDRAKAELPRVLSIVLPSGNEAPLNAASPVPKASIKVSPDSGGLEPAPDIGEPSAGTQPVAASSDAAARRLLAKIPKLDFMLESTLVLPEK